jgi:hypothetical protein
MKLIKTRSGRYINAYHAIAFSIEESVIEVEGKRRRVYNLVVHLPQPLLPAILGIYPTEEEAHQSLEVLVRALCGEESIVHVESHF